ncbi:MAG: hypothetical protein UW96_C0018G0017 [Candidatus Collierbacteria bacterium GW2011_GWA1_45_15]|nr:MAG: hypothetical protein UW96_C0018G0017 [Candidatus Collierbacteria bacterium GW2011_GWA1_45_15]
MPEANLGEAVGRFQIVVLRCQFSVVRWGAGEGDVLGIFGDIETEIGNVIAAVMKRRVGVSFDRGVLELDGDGMMDGGGGRFLGYARNDVVGLASDEGVGSVGFEKINWSSES